VAKTLGLEESGYRILANMGRHAHQEVPHFHVHIFGGRALGPMLVEFGE
jgi:diadenosine tetraphosphate (Ap4A) HIT family hydrolase